MSRASQLAGGSLNVPEHISNSQISLFTRCPEAWRRRYVEGDKIPPGIALLIGTGVHVGIETNFNQKIESHSDITPSQLRDAAVAGFESRLAEEGVQLTKNEQSIGEQGVIGGAIDVTADLATVHAVQVAPEYQPTMVEKRVELDLPKIGKTLVGVIDVADDKDRVTDFKTTGRTPSQDDANRSTQLTIYSVLHKHETGRPASEARLEVLTKTKKSQRKLFKTHRDMADFNALAARINAIVQSIEAGIFPPTEPGNWYCHPKWCGYFNTCPYVNAERIAKAKDKA